MSVLIAGSIAYPVVSPMLERRIRQEFVRSYAAEARGLEDVLARGLSTAGAEGAIGEEMDHLARTYGTTFVGLYDSEGGPVVVSGTPSQPKSTYLREFSQVIASQRPQFRIATTEDGKGARDYTVYLLPVASPSGPLALQFDQSGDVVSALLRDSLLVMAAVLGLVMVLAFPLCYVLGGRNLDRRRREAERAAAIDVLTGVSGRRGFRPALNAALHDIANDSVALGLIDVDDFKRVNDRLGHTHGDRVLIALGESFKAMRGSDHAFRIGGDEFAVVLPQADDEQATEVMQRVRRVLALVMPGVTISIGVASARTDDKVDLQELWERADAALYEAKRLGRNRTTSFSTISSSVTVTADKLDAVSSLFKPDASLTVVFQPIWDLRAGRILGHEALLRLPTDSPLAGPEEAFALAHRLGLASRLDEVARRVVLTSVSAHTWQGMLFLNIHPDALERLDIDALVDQLAAAGLAPHDVVVEVTEHADLDKPDHILVLKRAHASGLRLALDGLGRGNSGLRALTHVRFDVIKIDRRVVARLGVDPASDAAVAAATAFVLHSGGWVIAEGIEDPDTLSVVLHGTSHRFSNPPVLAGQGYLLGRPSVDPLTLDTTSSALPPTVSSTP